MVGLADHVFCDLCRPAAQLICLCKFTSILLEESKFPMDLMEYQGKQYFARFGIPVSAGDTADSVEEAVAQDRHADRDRHQQDEQVGDRAARQLVQRAGAAAGAAISAVVVAAMLLLAANLMLSAQVTFRQLFAVTCYAFLPNLLAGALAILTMYLKQPEDFDLENPTAFNIGFYLDPQTTPKWLVSVASSVDLFSIWVLLLLALGLTAAGRRLSYSKALVAVSGLWLLWVALKALRYALF